MIIFPLHDRQTERHSQSRQFKQHRYIRGCNQTFPNWPPVARTANGTALCH